MNNNELINVKYENGKQVVSARDLYLGLGLEPTHWKRWSEKNIVNDEFHEEGIDWTSFCLKGENPNGGRPTIDYAITLDFAKELAMMARTSKSKEYRQYFIECENQLKQVAIQSPKAFVDSLALTEYSIENYLPNFLTWKNVDEVIPLLIQRVGNSVDKGDIKIGVLNSVIKVTKEVRNACELSAQKEIMTMYIEQVQEKYDRVLIASKAGTTASNNRLQKRVEELTDERYSRQDIINYAEQFLNKSDYTLLANSLDEYIGFISKNKFNGDFKAATNYIYGIFKFERGIDLNKITKEEQKKLGVTSKREYIYLLNPEYLEYILSIALDEAKSLGFQF